MADQYDHLTESDVAEILRHKPAPEKKLAPELAKEYRVSPRFIHGIWDRGGLPMGGAAAKRKSTVDLDIMMEIVKLKGKLSAVEVADQFMVATRSVKKIWSTID